MGQVEVRLLFYMEAYIIVLNIFQGIEYTHGFVILMYYMLSIW